MMPRDRLTWPLEAFVSGNFKANKTTPRRATGVLRGPHLEEEARAGPAVWAAGSKIPSKLEHGRKESLGLTPKRQLGASDMVKRWSNWNFQWLVGPQRADLEKRVQKISLAQMGVTTSR